MFLKALTILAAVGTVLAQRPNDTSICDYYTPAVLKEENTPASQQKLMTLIAHTFILGNYTTPNLGVKVAGIAAPNEFEGHAVNLLPLLHWWLRINQPGRTPWCCKELSRRWWTGAIAN